MCPYRVGRTFLAMKRIASTLLWFYSGWTAGAFVDFLGGWYGIQIGPALGPILGTAAAALFVGDPRHLIWRRQGESSSPRVAELTPQQA